jgi:hypothetical protein
MPSAAEQVDNTFNKATIYATEAKTAAATFLSALEGAIYAPPTLSVTWDSIAAPTLPSLPAVPTLPTITFNAPGFTPNQLALAEPTITIDDFTEVAPTLTLSTPPTVTVGAVPTVPAVVTPTIPTAPTLPAVAQPTYLSLSTVTTPTIDLRDSWLTSLETVPALTLLEPTPYSYSRGADYASSLLSSLSSTLLARISGGSGFSTAVETALWARLRDREARTAQGNVDQISRTADALGFQLPAGVVAAQTRLAEQEYFTKVSEGAREISIKQAELEQANAKQAIESGIQLESQLIDYSFKMEQLAFESAKQYADNAIQLHNASVEKYRALLAAYEAYREGYKIVIDGQLALVEVYKAELQGEQTKAEVNRTLVEQYKAEIEAGLAQVQIYNAQVNAAQTLVQLEQAKIGAASEQIRAYVATINAETAKVEAYKASVEAETTKVMVYKTTVDAYAAKVSAQAERSRAEVSRYSALYQAKASEWEGYRSVVSAESERIRALGVQSETLLDGYKAATTSIVAEATMQSDIWKASMTQYEASKNIAIQTARLNNDAVLTTNNARLDAAKVGAQIYAQLTASAYSMIHASAGISGSGSNSVSYSYSNDTTTAVSPVTAV